MPIHSIVLDNGSIEFRAEKQGPVEIHGEVLITVLDLEGNCVISQVAPQEIVVSEADMFSYIYRFTVDGITKTVPFPIFRP